jgi:hypothetical protein
MRMQRWTTEIAIGELGLAVRHRFLYVFDYGDNHQFEIRSADMTESLPMKQEPKAVVTN